SNGAKRMARPPGCACRAERKAGSERDCRPGFRGGACIDEVATEGLGGVVVGDHPGYQRGGAEDGASRREACQGTREEADGQPRRTEVADPVEDATIVHALATRNAPEQATDHGEREPCER